MPNGRPLYVVFLLSLNACMPQPGTGSADMHNADAPTGLPVLDVSCEGLASELANCMDIMDGSLYKPCAVSAEKVAKCTDICADPSLCMIQDGVKPTMTSSYYGTYSVASGYQDIPERWPDSITLLKGNQDTNVVVSGSSLTEQKHRLYMVPGTLIEKDSRFALIGAVRHHEVNCARANLEVFVLSGKASGTTKQLGCLPIEVQHTYLPLQWCGQDVRARSKDKLVQFTTTWERRIEDGDRCAPQP